MFDRGNETKLLGQRFEYGIVTEFFGRCERRGDFQWKLLCDCGNEYISTTYKLTTCERKSCGKCSISKSKNKKTIVKFDCYGKIAIIDEDYDINNPVYKMVKCICECGTKKYFRLEELKNGCITHCGCEFKNRGKYHKLHQGYEDISKRYWNSVKKGATKRNLEFSIDIEYAWSIWVLQNKRCALSGLELSFLRSRSGSSGTASLDRLDSSLGYVENNVQWIHKDINNMKTDMNQEYFLNLCISVYNHKINKSF